MTAKSGDAAKAHDKARQAHQARQAHVKELQRQHVGDSHMAGQQLAESQQRLRMDVRDRHPEWFA